MQAVSTTSTTTCNSDLLLQSRAASTLRGSPRLPRQKLDQKHSFLPLVGRRPARASGASRRTALTSFMRMLKQAQIEWCLRNISYISINVFRVGKHSTSEAIHRERPNGCEQSEFKGANEDATERSEHRVARPAGEGRELPLGASAVSRLQPNEVTVTHREREARAGQGVGRSPRHRFLIDILPGSRVGRAGAPDTGDRSKRSVSISGRRCGR